MFRFAFHPVKEKRVQDDAVRNRAGPQKFLYFRKRNNAVFNILGILQTRLGNTSDIVDFHDVTGVMLDRGIRADLSDDVRIFPGESGFLKQFTLRGFQREDWGRFSSRTLSSLSCPSGLRKGVMSQ